MVNNYSIRDRKILSLLTRSKILDTSNNSKQPGFVPLLEYYSVVSGIIALHTAVADCSQTVCLKL